MTIKKDYFKHDASCLVLQVFFVVVCLIFLALGVFLDNLRIDGMYYFAAVAIWFGISLLTFPLPGRARHFFTIISMMVNASIIPVAIYACGGSAMAASLTSALFVMAVVIVGGNDVALTTALASVLAAFVFHDRISEQKTDLITTEYLWIGLTYFGLITIALGWRAVFTRLFVLVKGLPMPGQVSEDDYETIDDENKLLRNKIAKTIVNLNAITARDSKLGNE